MNNFSDALQYPFKDFGKNWINVLFYLICSLLIVTIPFALGYSLKASRKVVLNPESAPPQWDWSADSYLMGLRVFIMYFAYALPVFCIILAGFFLFIGTAAYAPNNDSAMAGGMMGFLGLTGLALLLSIPVGILGMGGYVLLIEDPYSFSSGLRLGRIFSMIMGNLGKFITYFIAIFIVNMIAGIVGQLLVFGTIITTPLAAFSVAYLMGRMGAELLRTSSNSSLYEDKMPGYNY